MAIFRSFAALLALALPLGLGVMSTSPARASSDDDLCDAVWKIDLATKAHCYNVAALTPGNDTRANLLLLLLDRHGLPTMFLEPGTRPILSWRDFRGTFAGIPQLRAGGDQPETDSAPADFAPGEGSRCRSGDTGGAAFAIAVAAAAGLSPDERTSLLAARAAFKPDCAGAKDADAIAATPAPSSPGPAPLVASAAGRAFAAYLRGVAGFYAGRFADAEADFGAAKGSKDPWLADAADYMVARTRVNAVQVGMFDDFGGLKDGAAIAPDRAEHAYAALDGYLRDYPDGRYAASARGLLRRVDWLAGRTDKLAARYSALMAEPPARRGIDDLALVEEIDSKLMPKLTVAATRDPLLLAVLDLEAMRRPPADSQDPKPVRPDLDAQREAFAGAPDLYAYLRAVAAFTLDGASAPVIDGLPDDARRRGGDYLWFSRQFLRGEALEAAGDRNALGFWRQLRPAATRPLDGTLVELALALDEERHGRLDDVFAPGSSVAEPAIREILLRHDAGPALLRAQAWSAASPESVRSAALSTLLSKELTRGRYADFLSDLASTGADVPATGSAPAPGGVGAEASKSYLRGESAGEIGCPPLPATAARLATEPASIRDRLCLAEFVRLHGMDKNPNDKPSAAGELGFAPSAFPGQPYARSDTYAAVIADRRASPDDRAFALYRAVKCYEPTGSSTCGPDAPRSARHGWFIALKRDYPGSRWAKRLSLWW